MAWQGPQPSPRAVQTFVGPQAQRSPRSSLLFDRRPRHDLATVARMSVTPVEVRGLVKRYGSIRAVDHVDLTVEAGDIYGYLGPNGAGKTTTLRMLLSLIRRDGGSVALFGRDPADGVAALDHVAGFVESPTF